MKMIFAALLLVFEAKQENQAGWVVISCKLMCLHFLCNFLTVIELKTVSLKYKIQII